METRKLEMEELHRLSPEQFREAEKTPVVVVLDNIRSLYNVGSVFRTSDAFRLEGLYLCGMTGKPPHRDIRKTALGATETVRWHYYGKTTEALKQLKKKGFFLWAVEQVEGSTPLQAYDNKNDKPLALIFGNEMYGVSEEVLAMVDGCLEIPQLGMKHSLNISVSVGIVLWEILRTKI